MFHPGSIKGLLVKVVANADRFKKENANIMELAPCGISIAFQWLSRLQIQSGSNEVGIDVKN